MRKKKIADEDLRQWLKAFTKAPVQVIPAVVVSVDEEAYTIKVKPLVGGELPDVRLKAGIDNVKEGVVEIPTVDSLVLISIIGNDPDTACVIKTSQVGKVVFNGGERPLVDWPKAKEELEKTREVVDAIKDALTNWVPVPTDGGTALKTAFTAAIGSKVTGSLDDTEDDKVLH